jgi:CxxC motif-containing protein
MTEFVCISCPIGCRLTVTREGDEIVVAGNRCPKGEVYGREETRSPKRVVTAVVRTDSKTFPFIPVRTDKPLPRPLIPDLIGELAKRSVHLPAARGALLIGNYRESGVSVVLTRTLPPEGISPADRPENEPSRGKPRDIQERNPEEQLSKLRGIYIPRKRDKKPDGEEPDSLTLVY